MRKLPKSNGIALPILILIVFFMMCSGIAGAFVATRMGSKQIPAVNKQTLETPTTNSSDQNTNNNNSASLNSTKLKDWEKLGIDSTWNMYKMNYLGFSVRIPRQMYIPNSACSFEKSNGKSSYRPKGGYTDVQLLNTEHTALFSNSDFSQLGDETEDDQGYHYFDTCTKTVVGLNNITSYGTNFWEFVTTTVNNEEDLLQFVRNHYGPGCDVTKKASTAQQGTYDVWVESGGMDDTECPINFMYTIKYSPVKKLAVLWNQGQSCTFVANENWTCYDDEVTGSFRFLD